MMDYDEQLARANEEELWLAEQTKKHEVRVNINWKHILKKAQENDTRTTVSWRIY